MAAGEVRVLRYVPTKPVVHPTVSDRDLQPARLVATRIGIEAVRPQVPDGAFAVKRLVGDSITVSADIIADGHDVLAAELLWAADERPRSNASRCAWSTTIAGRHSSCRRASAVIASPCAHGGTRGAPSGTICRPSMPPGRA